MRNSPVARSEDHPGTIVGTDGHSSVAAGRSRLSLLLVAMSACLGVPTGCGSKVSTSPAAPTAAALQDTSTAAESRDSLATIFGRCPSGDCGTNSPAVNGFPINGLSAGKTNREGFTLVLKSFTKAGSDCVGGTLDVEDDELVVKTDSQWCKGGDLQGGRFKVKRGDKTRELIISDVGRYCDEWLTDTSSEGAPRQVSCTRLKYIYKIRAMRDDYETYKEDTTVYCTKDRILNNDPKCVTASLCNRFESQQWRDQWPLPNAGMSPLATIGPLWDKFDWAAPAGAATSNIYPPDRAASASPAEPAFDLVVFKSEGYATDLTPLGQTDTAWDASFFHLACARDALAKLDIDRIEQHKPFKKLGQTPSDEDKGYLLRRVAALKMMTADFCDGTRYTTDRAELFRIPYKECEGENGFDPARCVLPDVDPALQPVEAIWDQHGALCISSTRLVQAIALGAPATIFPICTRGTCGYDGITACKSESGCHWMAGKCMREAPCHEVNLKDDLETEADVVDRLQKLCSAVRGVQVGRCETGKPYPGALFVSRAVRPHGPASGEENPSSPVGGPLRAAGQADKPEIPYTLRIEWKKANGRQVIVDNLKINNRTILLRGRQPLLHSPFTYPEHPEHDGHPPISVTRPIRPQPDGTISVSWTISAGDPLDGITISIYHGTSHRIEVGRHGPFRRSDPPWVGTRAVIAP